MHDVSKMFPELMKFLDKENCNRSLSNRYRQVIDR